MTWGYLRVALGRSLCPPIALSKDVRDITVADLLGHDCVMHLVAISNGPMGEIDARVISTINRDASIRLAQKAEIPRFLFATSCSVYGAGKKLDLDGNRPT
jgi:nucleoside-diphosphate-sugar epimerase